LLAQFAPADSGVVKADRVNLRGQAKANAEIITQVGKGDRVTILDKKTVPYGNRTMTWLKVSLPDKATVWIKAEFVKDAVVTAGKVNLRSGGGVNFSIIGQAHKGDQVQIVRTVADWHEIRPLPGSYGWVSADYVELTPEIQAPPPAEEVRPAPAAEATPQPTPGSVQAVTETEVTPGPTAGEPAVGEPASEAVTREGVVYTCTGFLMKRPGTHYLAQQGGSKPHIIAYLKSSTIPLERFEGQKVQVIGLETKPADWQNPVIDVQQVQPMW
jgi:uncharacterized protein YgiM (DUF1202 family)